MRSVLEQLDSPQAILLMYLADELPAADRLEVEQRLEAEPELRRELDELRSVDAALRSGFAALDSTHAPSASAAGARRIGRIVRQWQVDRAAAEAAAAAASPPSKAWWWAYPLGAAAVLLIGFIIWWGTQPTDTTELVQEQTPRPVFPDEFPRMGIPFPRVDPLQDSGALADAERELAALEYLRIETR